MCVCSFYIILPENKKKNNRRNGIAEREREKEKFIKTNILSELKTLKVYAFCPRIRKGVH